MQVSWGVAHPLKRVTVPHDQAALCASPEACDYWRGL